MSRRLARGRICHDPVDTDHSQEDAKSGEAQRHQRREPRPADGLRHELVRGPDPTDGRVGVKGSQIRRLGWSGSTF